jgi:glycosyltransferase involved in cell wall biosynthesis
MAALCRKPLVSVVTPSYQQGKFIERTLRSVLCQDYPAVEYIVVDALSTDDTPAVLERYREAIGIVIREKDAGFADALHKGFARSSGEILAYLNADDCYAGPAIVSRAIACFRQYPGAEVIFGRRVIVNETGHFVSRWPYVRFDAATLQHVDFIPQECAFWRRSVWERAGSFIDRNLDFAVDYDLWLRFLACGADFIGVNEVFGLFREHSTQKSQTRWREDGWPEVRRLHQQLGIVATEADLAATFDRHTFGTGVLRQLRRCWHALGDRRARRTAAGKPLDEWTLGRPITMRHQSALSA